MSVVLNDEQYGSMMHALVQIAAGRRTNPKGYEQRFARRDLIDIARRACIACDLDFSLAANIEVAA